jgi:hypothetical protein
MSHFTEALFLRKQLQQLINENNLLHRKLHFLVEAAPVADETPSPDETMRGSRYVNPERSPAPRQFDPIYSEFMRHFNNMQDFQTWFMRFDPQIRYDLIQAWGLLTPEQRELFNSNLVSIWTEMSDILSGIDTPQMATLLHHLLHDDITEDPVTADTVRAIVQSGQMDELNDLLKSYRDMLARIINMVQLNRVTSPQLFSMSQKRYDQLIRSLTNNYTISSRAHTRIIGQLTLFANGLSGDLFADRALLFGKKEAQELLDRAIERRNAAEAAGNVEEAAAAQDIIDQVKRILAMGPNVSGRTAAISSVLVAAASLFGGGTITVEGIWNWVEEFLGNVVSGEYDFELGPGGFQWSNPSNTTNP